MNKLLNLFLLGSLGFAVQNAFAVDVGLQNQTGKDVCIQYSTKHDIGTGIENGVVVAHKIDVSTGPAQKVANNDWLWIRHPFAWSEYVKVFDVNPDGTCSNSRIDYGGTNEVMFYGGKNEPYQWGLPTLETGWVNYRYYLKKK